MEMKKSEEMKIQEWSMGLYYSEENTLGENIDHNDFTSIWEDGYKHKRKEIESKDKQIKILWEALKEQHLFRVEDELSFFEIEDSWSMLVNRVNSWKLKES